MFLSKRVRCTLKYACEKVNDYHLNFSRPLKSLVNKEHYSQTLRLTCLYNHQVLQISTLPILAKESTNKDWKLKVSGGAIQDKLACEDGKEAVLHAELVTELQKCPTVASQIEKFCSKMSLTCKDLEKRKAFCLSLEEALSKYFKHFRVTLFGSSVNGLGFKGCDVDVCFQLFNNEKGYQTLIKEVPSLESVLDGTVSQKTLESMTPHHTLGFIKRILRQHCPDVNKDIIQAKGRVPILKFYDEKYGIFIDLSFENQTSLRNTMLLRFLSHLDERFTSIAKIVRYWGKYGGFVGDLATFNSYSFSLLVVHFLQTRNPPVIPAIQDILKESEYLRSGTIDDIDLLHKDLKSFPSSQNTQTAEELLKEFFFYFFNFSFNCDPRVMLLSSSSSVPKNTFVPDKTTEDVFQFANLNIQDPFMPSFNVSRGASFKSYQQFMVNLLKTCEAYQNESLWNPKTENWGLCSLLHKPIEASLAQNEWKGKHNHSIDLPLIPDGPKKLQNLLQHGLLFQTDDIGKDPRSQIHFKLHCKAYHKTWKEREFVQNLQLTNSCVLEREHLISKELINQSGQINKRQVLCEFQCECVEVVSNGKSSLVLNLNFMRSKFSTIVAIFLKQFIPDIYRKLQIN